MKLITNIKSPFLSDIIFKKSKNFDKIEVAVAYCKNYELFEYCKKKKIKLDYFARLDDSINLDLECLKSFLTSNISIYIIGGNKFHPKVIWCNGYGAYIGSANLTLSAWWDNIECGLWLTQKELKTNNLLNPLNKFFNFIQKESKPLKDISKKDILKLNEHKQIKNQANSISNSEVFPIIRGDFGIFKGCSKDKYLNIKSQVKRNPPFDQKNLNSEVYQKDSIWNNKNEVRCLIILKQLKEEGFTRGRRSSLCREMSLEKDAVPSFNSIYSKVSNYEYLDTKGKKGLSNVSQNTKNIYKEYKKTSIKALKNFCFFEELRNQLRKIKEIEGFKIGKPIGKDRNGISITFKKNTIYRYKGHIRIFRPENPGYRPYIAVYYTWFRNKDNEMEFKFLKQKMDYLIKRDNEPLKVNIYKKYNVKGFYFHRKGWKTDTEDKQWIVDRVIDLLKALKNP